MSIDNAEFLKEALATGAAIGEIKNSEGEARPYVVVPPGYTAKALADSDLKIPFRLRQKVSVFDPKSFTEYFTDYCNEDSRIFADTQKPGIVGVIDYHRANATSDAKWAGAEWTEHVLSYEFRHTREWKTWAEKNRQNMKQIEFARFIEDNLPDIIRPSHAEMLQISRTMEAKKNVNFSSGVRLSNGEIQLVYQEEIRGTAAQGTLEIPEVFVISIAPFEGSEAVEIQCRLRYQINENALLIRYEMVRPHKVVDAAVLHVVEAIRQGVVNPITFGAI